VTSSWPALLGVPDFALRSAAMPMKTMDDRPASAKAVNPKSPPRR